MGSERHNIVATQPAAKHPLPPNISEIDVRVQLEHIRSSQPFRSSRRCVLFLDFVVQAALKGHLETLKERTLGVEVFGRDPNYDTNQDPVVRGTASEVRKRLAQYYQISGHEQELKIELPSGSYLPEFHRTPDAALVRAPRPSSIPGRKHRLWLYGFIALMLLATAALLSLSRRSGNAQSTVDQFWAPILGSPGPVLLCVGQPKVYNFLEPLESEVTKRLPGPGQPRFPLGRPDGQLSIDLGQVVPMWDRYISIGDAICLSDVAGFLAEKDHGYHIRGGASTSFADLRENPTVLIGAFTNDWTLRLTGELRFSLRRDPNGGSPHVYDRLNPSNRKWQLTNEWPDWKMPLDYAIVSRLLDPTTGKIDVTAAGITQYGTAAAGEFLTNPEYLSRAIRQAPRDWQHMNIQVVLATRVIGGTAGPPQVLATQFW
jgi:hypothetical protein